jgi:hypothetical protein
MKITISVLRGDLQTTRSNECYGREDMHAKEVATATILIIVWDKIYISK